MSGIWGIDDALKEHDGSGIEWHLKLVGTELFAVESVLSP